MHLQIFSQKTQKKVCLFRKKAYLCTGFEKKPEKYRGVEQLVARWAHNPKVVCSSQASATTERNPQRIPFFVSYLHIPRILRTFTHTTIKSL